MNKDQVQLFKNDYAMRCSTFSCGEAGVHFVGRPDAPFSTNYTLCEKCSKELAESIAETYELHAKAVHAPKTDEEIAAEQERLLAEAIELEEAAKQAELDAASEDGPEGEVFELETILEDANTHAELDKLIEELGLTGVLAREDEAGKHTLVERKTSIIEAADAQLTEVE